jgi:hypothetical protein
MSLKGYGKNQSWPNLRYYYFHEGTKEKTMKNSNKDGRYPGQDSNHTPSKYKLEGFLFDPTCSTSVRVAL